MRQFIALAGLLLLGATTMLSLTSHPVLAGLTELGGIQNCQNKCNKVFDRTQYSISDQPNSATFEFRSCMIGCNQCSSILAANGLREFDEEAHLSAEEPADDGLLSLAISQRISQNLDQEQDPQQQSCFRYCKRFNYASQGIRKGVIEPDKACLMGCVINTCQEVCLGGTTDNTITPENRLLWWREPESSGCSIKTGLRYVQNPNYGNPNAGQGASAKLKQCCTNAFNLCNYRGNQQSVNFQNVVVVARRSCASFVNHRNNNTLICDFYNTEQNCGTPGLPPPTLPPN